MKALILIGGEGTRLRPLTLNTLKCMVPIVNKHFFEHQFELLKEHGINEVILSICHMPDKIKRILGTGKKYGMKIKYAIEEKPLGTGGAIKNAEKYMDDTTVIMNGDVLTDINLKKLLAIHKKNKAAATISLVEVEDPTAYGLVSTNKKDRILRFLEKPTWGEIDGNRWINAGMYIFDKRVLDLIPKNKSYSLERQVFPQILESGDTMMAYKSEFYWLDIGKIDKYLQANFDILEERFKFPYDYSKALKHEVKIGRGVTISKNAFLRGASLIGDYTHIADATISPLTIIGSHCSIGKGSAIEKTIIWDNVKIGENVILKDCIIGSNSVIHSNSILHGAIIGDGTKITKHSKLGVI